MSDKLSETERLERLAMREEPMPEGTGTAGKLFYLCVRELYNLYRNGGITRDEAKEIKAGLLADYKNNSFDERLLQHHAAIRNRCSEVMTEAEKHGCPICRKLVRIFDGREK